MTYTTLLNKSKTVLRKQFIKLNRAAKELRTTSDQFIKATSDLLRQDQAREDERRKLEEANTRFAIICQILGTIGIEVFNEYGDTRPFGAIMDEIKDKWLLLDNDYRKMLVDAFSNYMI